MSTAVAGVGVLAILALLWVSFTRLKADWTASEEARPPGPPGSFRPVPPPAQDAPTVRPSTPAPVGLDARASATWPLESFELDARKHVFGVSSGRAALGTLDANADWRLVETTVPGTADRGRPMPALFFLLTGPGVDAAAAVGPVSRKAETLHGASGLLLFTLGPPSPEDLPGRTVSVTSLRTGEVQRHALHPEWMTATLDRTFFLTGLLPEESYRLTLEPVGQGAFTRGRERGPALTVACVQRERPEDQEPERASRFLLSHGEEVRITGMRGLSCGFVDEDPSDNEGAVSIHIEKTRPQPERSTPVVRQAASRSPGLEKKAVPAAGGTASARTTDGALDVARDLFKAGKLEAARTKARQCVAQAPDHVECHLLLGSVAARLGRREEGAKHYRRFLELAPGNHPQASQVIRTLQEYEAE
ncbi:tetratricopeptide repeat protein [Pyxidicoccus sp. 3LFB2]